MTPRYVIHTAPREGAVYLRVAGLFTVEQATAFRGDRDRALLALTCPPDTHVTLCDVADCLIQPKDAAMVFGRMIADPPRRSRRMAIVTGSALAQMQVGRWIGERKEISVFRCASAALDWLGDDTRPVLDRLIREAETVYQPSAASFSSA